MAIVKLSNTQKIGYYLFPTLMFAFGCIPFYYLVMGKTNHNLTPGITAVSMAVLWLFSLLSCIKQVKGFQFHSISTDTTVKLKMKITKKILRDYNWRIVQSTSNFIQADGFGFRDKIDLRTWDELLTIQVKSDEILINSICNPEGPFTQFASFGKNKQNIRDFEMLYLQEMLNHNN